MCMPSWSQHIFIVFLSCRQMVFEMLLLLHVSLLQGILKTTVIRFANLEGRPWINGVYILGNVHHHNISASTNNRTRLLGLKLNVRRSPLSETSCYYCTMLNLFPPFPARLPWVNALIWLSDGPTDIQEHMIRRDGVEMLSTLATLTFLAVFNE